MPKRPSCRALKACRFDLIDVDEQHKGYGAATIDALVRYLSVRRGADILYTSCADGPGSPRGFYLRTASRTPDA